MGPSGGGRLTLARAASACAENSVGRCHWIAQLSRRAAVVLLTLACVMRVIRTPTYGYQLLQNMEAVKLDGPMPSAGYDTGTVNKHRHPREARRPLGRRVA